jgi:hypothetical protein
MFVLQISFLDLGKYWMQKKSCCIYIPMDETHTYLDFLKWGTIIFSFFFVLGFQMLLQGGI